MHGVDARPLTLHLCRLTICSLHDCLLKPTRAYEALTISMRQCHHSRFAVIEEPYVPIPGDEGIQHLLRVIPKRICEPLN